MAFSSVQFLFVFLPLSLAVYWLCPKWLRNAVLAAFSLLFFAWAGLKGAAILVLLAGINWLGGLSLGRLAHKRPLLILLILLDLAVLGGFKYAGFAAETVNALVPGLLPVLSPALPLGLSFYVFTAIGYCADVAAGKVESEKNPIRFAVFLAFFGHGPSGPIVRYGQQAPQLDPGSEMRRVSADRFCYGIKRLVLGLAKKAIIADQLALIYAKVASVPAATLPAPILVLGYTAYMMQLYFDFSGGIDITRGVAEMFGIHVVENFRRPIFATSLTDYWRRWHITLGAWMRDYVFYPMSLSKPLGKLGKLTRRKIGGKLGKIIPTSIATFTVYFIIGIWHGANFRYVFFGFWNGALITGAFLLDGTFVKMKNRLGITGKEGWYHGFQMLRTMVLVFIGRYVSRAPRLLTAFSMLWTTVSRPQLSQLRDGILLKLGLGGRELAVVAVGVLVLLAVEGAQEKGVAIRKAMERQNLLIQWLGILVPLLVLLVFGILRDSTISAEFIYKQF